MDRDVILVTGLTGYGKSLWGRLYTQSTVRLLVYDPAGDFNVLFLPIDMIYEEVVERRSEAFRLGSFCREDVDALSCMAFGVGDVLTVIEEASTVFQKGQRLESWAHRLTFLGRHRRCSVMILAQRAVSIPIDFRSQANRVISFCQHEPDDLLWLKEFFRRNVMELPSFPKWYCLDWQSGHVSDYSIKTQAEHLLGIRMELDTRGERAYKYTSE